ERFLGFRLPRSYRSFVKRFGAGILSLEGHFLGGRTGCGQFGHKPEAQAKVRPSLALQACGPIVRTAPALAACVRKCRLEVCPCEWHIWAPGNPKNQFNASLEERNRRFRDVSPDDWVKNCPDPVRARRLVFFADSPLSLNEYGWAP